MFVRPDVCYSAFSNGFVTETQWGKKRRRVRVRWGARGGAQEELRDSHDKMRRESCRPVMHRDGSGKQPPCHVITEPQAAGRRGMCNIIPAIKQGNNPWSTAAVTLNSASFLWHIFYCMLDIALSPINRGLSPLICTWWRPLFSSVQTQRPI